jgi:hypothetical protein
LSIATEDLVRRKVGVNSTFSSIMSRTWWFARVKDTNVEFVEKTSRGYLFVNTDKGNKTVDVSKLTSLHALRVNFCMLPY